MLHAIAAALGGLGIFFAGMYLLKENLKKLTGRRFKQIVARWTRQPAAAVVVGLAAGGIMQSTTAVTFILASMIAAGLIGVSGALPIIAGANVGATFLVMLATLDVQVFVLFVLGITGLSFTIERLAHLRSLAAAVFGIALVFFGLKMLQSGVAPLTREPWFLQVLTLAGASYLLPLLLAVALVQLSQSSASVVILAITVSAAGGLTFEQAMMAIYGANIGSACQSLLLSSNLRGRPKQVVMFQVLFNLVTATLMVPLFFVEQYLHLPLMEALVQRIGGEPSFQLAMVQVTFNAVGAALMLTLLPRIGSLLVKRFPERHDEDDGRPVFIHDQAIAEPQSALDLARMEQRRLASYLPRALMVARLGTSAPDDLERLNANFVTLSGAVNEFLRSLRDAPLDVAGYDRLNRTLHQLRLLDGLNETVVELARAARRGEDKPLLSRLIGNVVEGLDAVLLTMADAMGEGGGEDIELFHGMTRQRGEVMHRLREAYLAADAELTAPQKGTILIVTNLAERSLWLLGQMAEEEVAAAAAA